MGLNFVDEKNVADIVVTQRIILIISSEKIVMFQKNFGD